MAKDTKIPNATIERISIYSRPLEKLLEEKTIVISSERLASLCKVNPAQVRKDLSYFGEFGVRGIGYDVADLLRAIQKILVSDREWNLAIVGIGPMGRAFISHDNFLKRGYRFVAAFDPNPRKVGLKLPHDLAIKPMNEMKNIVEKLKIEIGIITTRPSQAQMSADLLNEAGVRAILNFSPIHVRQPENCIVENADFTFHLDDLAYQLSQEVKK